MKPLDHLDEQEVLDLIRRAVAHARADLYFHDRDHIAKSVLCNIEKSLVFAVVRTDK